LPRGGRCTRRAFGHPPFRARRPTRMLPPRRPPDHPAPKAIMSATMTSRPGAALLPVLVLCACGGGDDAPVSIRTDSAGIEIVTYPGPDRPSPLSFTEELRLGGSDTDPNQSFFNVNAGVVGADAAGNIYVLDYAASRVVVFDANGEFVRSMGRA